MKRVDFTKEQIDALQQINSKAIEMFNEEMASKPYMYYEYDRAHLVRCYKIGILNSLIENGFIYVKEN